MAKRAPKVLSKYEVWRLIYPESPIYLVHIYRSTYLLSARIQVEHGLLWNSLASHLDVECPRVGEGPPVTLRASRRHNYLLRSPLVLPPGFPSTLEGP